MANPVLKGQVFKQTAVQFGSALVLPFETVPFTGAIQLSTVSPSATRALPCNVKVLAVAVEFESTTAGTQVPILTAGLNISSGAPAAGSVSFVAGTYTITGTATANGTISLIIVGPTPGTSQTITANLVNTAPAATAATALATVINQTANAQVYASAAAGVITLTQLTPQNLLAQMGGQQTYQGSSATTGITVAPTVPTLFPTNPNSPQIGTPDNFGTSTPSSTFAGAGQFVFGKFRTLTTTGTPPLSPNLVQYAGMAQGGLPGTTGTFSLPEYDIILPCTRGITIWIENFSGFPATIVANASALVVPVILDPNQPYPVAGMWVPNNTNLGAPSTA